MSSWFSSVVVLLHVVTLELRVVYGGLIWRRPYNTTLWIINRDKKNGGRSLDDCWFQITGEYGETELFVERSFVPEAPMNLSMTRYLTDVGDPIELRIIKPYGANDDTFVKSVTVDGFTVDDMVSGALEGIKIRSNLGNCNYWIINFVTKQYNGFWETTCRYNLPNTTPAPALQGTKPPTSLAPTEMPTSKSPTELPTEPSIDPSEMPSIEPSHVPTNHPTTQMPTADPIISDAANTPAESDDLFETMIPFVVGVFVLLCCFLLSLYLVAQWRQRKFMQATQRANLEAINTETRSATSGVPAATGGTTASTAAAAGAAASSDDMQPLPPLPGVPPQDEKEYVVERTGGCDSWYGGPRRVLSASSATRVPRTPSMSGLAQSPQMSPRAHVHLQLSPAQHSVASASSRAYGMNVPRAPEPPQMQLDAQNERSPRGAPKHPLAENMRYDANLEEREGPPKMGNMGDVEGSGQVGNAGDAGGKGYVMNGMHPIQKSTNLDDAAEVANMPEVPDEQNESDEPEQLQAYAGQIGNPGLPKVQNEEEEEVGPTPVQRWKSSVIGNVNDLYKKRDSFKM